MSIQVKKKGGKISLELDENDPLTGQVLDNTARLLKKNGRIEESRAVQAITDETPEIDPGG